ncbi:hypothetical protein [Marinobacter halodurans]|uniref:hypothetical protein n=1 Tax=Marinobacter halodurans TaxID=2528979 RepID=UPI0013F149FC|nr:hypothetical protein [Marinobacter halodurans]
MHAVIPWRSQIRNQVRFVLIYALPASFDQSGVTRASDRLIDGLGYRLMLSAR